MTFPKPTVSLDQGLNFYQSFSALIAVLEDRIENVSMKSHVYGISFVSNGNIPILGIYDLVQMPMTESVIPEKYCIVFYKEGVPINSYPITGFDEQTFDEIIQVVISDYKLKDSLNPESHNPIEHDE